MIIGIYDARGKGSGRAHIVIPGRDARRDVVVPVLDGAPLLAREEVRAGGDGEVELVRV